MTGNALLILASGAGMRNAMFTYNNAAPKCLMSVGDRTCLEAIIDSYKHIVDQVFIALQDRHANLVTDILNFRGYDNFTVICYPEQKSAIESLEAALTLMPKSFSRLFINWSDVFADAMTVGGAENTIFTDAKYVHRNIAFIDDNKRVKVDSTFFHEGNVPGIFMVSKDEVDKFLDESDVRFVTTDFDRWLANDLQNKPEKLSICKLQTVHDIGDFKKYNAYMESIKKEQVCRYFNKLTVDKDYVYKQPVTDKGRELHKIELAYYRRFGRQVSSMAKLLGYDQETETMQLARIKGMTCQEFVNRKVTAEQKLRAVNLCIKKFNDAIEQIHELPIEVMQDSQEDLKAAERAEFYDAIISRVQPCAKLIQSVISQNNIKSVEGMPIVSFDKMLAAVEAWLTAKQMTNWFKWGICHGDPNTDNSLICNNKIYFVDPRGYFGKLKTLGLGVQQYDLAKFAYGFSGYSKLNSAEYLAMQIDNGNVQFFVGARELSGITDVNLFDMKVSRDIQVLVGIIWVKLTSYIINDPMKSVAAYLYGNALLTKLLDIKP